MTFQQHRQVTDLVWARVAQKAPFGTPRPRGNTAKAAGVRYERALARQLPGARHGQWIEFLDRNGLGICQPDFILDHGEFVVVLECKYTWTSAAHAQIDQLYRPVLAKLLGKPLVGVVVCKRLVPDMGDTRIASSYREAVDHAKVLPQPRVVWHWMPQASPFVGRSQINGRQAL